VGGSGEDLVEKLTVYKDVWRGANREGPDRGFKAYDGEVEDSFRGEDAKKRVRRFPIGASFGTAEGD